MPFPPRLTLLIGAALVAQAAVSSADEALRLEVDPPALELVGCEAAHQLLVTAVGPNGVRRDRTAAATYRLVDPTLAAVTGTGRVSAKKDGETTLEITSDGCTVAVKLSLRDTTRKRSPSFVNDIEPLLSRFACNASGCHGKAEGQNGFKLSVFGFDPDADYRAIVRESRGRRVFPAAPEQSLILQKAAGGRPHGGGVRLTADRPELQLLHDWIAAGMPFGGEEPTVTKIELSPRERRLEIGGEQQLRVIAEWSDGRREDVTRLARFQSNNEGLAAVDEEGHITAGQTPGVVAAMASFMGQVDVFQAILPRTEAVASSPPAPRNFIDEKVYHRLAQLNIEPAGECSDAEFLRRVSLDLIGAPPTAEEARKFLADARENKRTLVVDELLQRPEFAVYWALKFSDLMRVDRQTLGHKGAYEYYGWIRASLAANKPLDQFARELITAEGPLAETPAAQFFKTVPAPGKAAAAVSQIFYGVRIECAECHHHPYDRWTQTDYQGMAAFFAPLQRKTAPAGDWLVAVGDPVTKHPRTNEVVTAYALGDPMPEKNPAGDRRRELARRLTAPDNPYFARNWANRLWAHMLGRGIVEPVDDFRATNPPSNPELLDALAAELIRAKYDLRSLLRTIATSRVYQQSSQVNASNARDEQNYSRFLLKRLDAEVLLDAVCQATGVPEKFPGVPSGAKAVELWDSQVDHDFLRMFGRPTRQSTCECERVSEPSVGQVFHLLNSERVQAKLSREDGRIAQLFAAHHEDAPLVDELYLAILARPPTADERARGVKYLQSACASRDTRLEATEDLAWTLLNSLEFVFNH